MPLWLNLLLSNELMGRLLREFWQIVGRHHLRALIYSNFQPTLLGIFQCHEVNIIDTISWFYWIGSKSINKISHICFMLHLQFKLDVQFYDFFFLLKKYLRHMYNFDYAIWFAIV
jgi:hypothetical protein